MFGNRERSGASTEGKAPKRRREGRGLGPFTSGHLTIIIVTLVIVVAFPFAAFAVTGNNVFVTDASSGVQAHVDAKNNLNTGIHDPVNGTAARVNGFGQLTTAASGTVNARDALPTKPIVITPQTAPSTPPSVIYGPVSKPFAIGSLTLNNNCNATEFFQLYTRTSVGTADVAIEQSQVLAFQTMQLTYPIPIVTTPPGGGTVTLKAASSGGCIKVDAFGYQT
jgi:hypothetical protein